MGSFAFTCCISGLPIEYGDKVRYLMLTRGSSLRERPCYMNEEWFPRVCPIKATYNDYGSVEKIEEGPSRDIWLEGFQRDLVEKGTGDNSCHDSPVKKDMTFDMLLKALWEQRVEVYKHPETQNHSTYDQDQELLELVPEYVPTMARIEKLLIGTFGENKFYVDDEHGYFRVRAALYEGKEDMLFRAGTALGSMFATVTCAGSGEYADEIELRVFMQPGKDAKGHPRHDYTFRKAQLDSESTTSEVRQAMIREDVWQAILKHKIVEVDFHPKTGKSFEKYTTIAHFRAGLKKYLKTARPSLRRSVWTAEMGETARKSGMSEELNKILSTPDLELDTFPRRADPNLKGSWIVASSGISSGMGISQHFDLLLEKGPVPDSYVNALAEFAFVQAILESTRYMWRPSYSTGPQFGDWDMHTGLFKALYEVSAKVLSKQQKEQEEE